MDFNNHAQRSTPPSYLDEDNPLGDLGVLIFNSLQLYATIHAQNHIKSNSLPDV